MDAKTLLKKMQDDIEQSKRLERQILLNLYEGVAELDSDTVPLDGYYIQEDNTCYDY